MKALNLVFFGLLFCFCFSFPLAAQVGINSDGAQPNPSAMLDLKSTTKGFLTPRMTQTERDGIANPATSLLIYQTDQITGFYYNKGTPAIPSWIRIGSDDNNPIIKETRIPIDDVALLTDYNGSTATLYAITEPGSYYLTGNILLSESGVPNDDRKGIIIDASNVTLDLNGYALLGDRDEPTSFPFPIVGDGSSDAIAILGDENNITIKNGFIANWRGDGVIGTSSFNCLFENLHVSNVFNFGLSVGNYNIIKGCSAFYCGENAISASISAFFLHCRSSNNDADGISGGEGSQYVNCTAFDNQENGIDAGVGSLILGCTLTDNTLDGISASGSSSIMECSAYDNLGNGINVAEDCTVQSCITAFNEGDGININAGQGKIINNVSHENDISGIHCASGSNGSLIQDNRVTDNDVTGILVNASGCFIFKNVAAGNNTDYNMGSGSRYGPIVNVVNSGDISGTANADHPLANFTY